MRVSVVGAGAVGSFLAAVLAAAGHDVTLLSRTQPREPGAGRLVLVGVDGVRRAVPVTRTGGPARLPRDQDAVVLAVKRFDLEAACALLAGDPVVPAVTVQNGIGAEELVAARRPGSPLVAASLTTAVELDAGGAVHRLSGGGIGLAAAGDGPGKALPALLAGAFAAGGLPAAVLPDAAAMKWSKLLANLVGNATSALLDAPVSEILTDPRLFEVERQQQAEALAVMARLGLRPVRLPGASVPLLVLGFRLPAALGRPILARVLGGARGGKMPSLRLALRGGPGPTEVAWLNGAVADAAARLGLAAPVNAALRRLVEEGSADPGSLARFRDGRDRLIVALGAEPASR